MPELKNPQVAYFLGELFTNMVPINENRAPRLQHFPVLLEYTAGHGTNNILNIFTGVSNHDRGGSCTNFNYELFAKVCMDESQNLYFERLERVTPRSPKTPYMKSIQNAVLWAAPPGDYLNGLLEIMGGNVTPDEQT